MPHVILILLVSFALIIAIIAAQLFLRLQAKNNALLKQDEEGAEGAPRFIFTALYLSFFWALFAYWLPMLLAYRERLAATPLMLGRIELAAKLSILPMFFLLLIFLGRRRGYMQWIKQLHWPSDEY